MTWWQLRLAGLSGAVILAAWLIWNLRPEPQIRRAFDGLITQVENRNWEKMKGFLSPNYKDQWGLNRDQLIRLSSEVFRQFLFLEITSKDLHLRITGDSAEITVTFQLAGRGSALAEMAITRAAELREPFTLTWHRESWKPWDWKLASVAQSEIYLDPSISWE